MRRKRGIPSVVEKSREISRALQIYWIAAVLFGLLLVLYTISSFATFDLWTILITVFFAVNFITAVMGIRELKKFKMIFTEDPETYKNKSVRHPILYRAVFWFLPMFD